MALLHLNLAHAPVRLSHHGIEEFRALDWEEQKRQPLVVEGAQTIGRKPDGIRQPHHHGFLRLYQRQGAEDGIT